jgi:hypothetical protein
MQEETIHGQPVCPVRVVHMGCLAFSRMKLNR